MIILIATFFTLLLQCNGDISESINQQLPLNSFARIPIPTQSLLPPTFENPIRDYTVGLVPPPIDGQSPRDEGRLKIQQHKAQPHNHVYSSSHTHPNGFINTARPFRNSVQQRSGHSAVHHQIHHSSNLLQPQVYQPKTAIYQPSQQLTPHHHPHHNAPPTYSAGIVRQPVATVAQHHHHHHNHFQNNPQYYEPVTQSRVHQHSTHTQYASIPVQGTSTVQQHAHPSVQKSAFVPRPVSSSGSSIIQTYPSVSYVVTAQHGSTLNFGNSKLDPELVHIISKVYGQNH